MSTPLSRKLVEGRSGELFVVVGNPDVGYTLHHAQLSEVGHYKRSWQAVQRARDGHDEVAVPVLPREQLVGEGAGSPVPAPSSTPSSTGGLVEGDFEFCPSSKDSRNGHCSCWSDCEPCHWCGDDTPDPLCDCERCTAAREVVG